jgi:hypothetical protein
MNSQSLGELAKALAKAQSELAGAKKDATNPHFRSQYADLASVWDACRKPLADNGLSVLQYTTTRFDRQQPILVTLLVHASGESVEGETPLLYGKEDMQALGSAITYARRYGLAAMVGVAPEDDDGNAAVEPATVKAAKPAGYDEWTLDITAAAENGLDALREAWKSSKAEYRNHAGSSFLDALKAKAAARVAVPA